MRAGILICLALGLVVATPAIPAADETALAVVVNPDRAGGLNVGEVALIFLRKRRFWEDGAPIVALNREPGTAPRETFSRHVLHASPAQLQAYWNQEYFEGVFPPT